MLQCQSFADLKKSCERSSWKGSWNSYSIVAPWCLYCRHRAFVIPSTIKKRSTRMTVKRKKINIYPGLRLPAGHIYDVISSLMYALRHIMDGRTFHPACYDFANTTLELCGYMFPAAMQGVYPGHIRGWEVWSVWLARRRASLCKCMYSRHRIPKWQQRNFYFCPPDSLWSVRSLFLNVVLHGNQRRRVASIIHSLSTCLYPPNAISSRLVSFITFSCRTQFILRRIKLFREMSCNSTGKSWGMDF